MLTFRKKQKIVWEKKVRRLEKLKKAAGTKGLIECTPTPAQACAIQRLVIALTYRHEFGLPRNGPMPACPPSKVDRKDEAALQCRKMTEKSNDPLD